MKIWAKVLTQHKIVQDTVEEFSLTRPVDADGWRPVIGTLCKPLDLAVPVILDKHVKDLQRFSRTVFSPSDFMESVAFDRFEIEIFPEKKKDRRTQILYGDDPN